LRRRPLIGFSRIIGFSTYFASVMERKIAIGEDALALSYVLQCARMAEGRIWTGVIPPVCPPELPPVMVPDPVLKFYLSHRTFLLYGILPHFLKDPKSRNYSVLFGQQLA